MNHTPPCPLCGNTATLDELRQRYCWMSCSNCNVVYPQYATEPRQPIVRPESTECRLERNESALVLTPLPSGCCADWSLTTLRGIIILAWLGAAAICGIFCVGVSYIKLLPELWRLSALLLAFILFGGVILYYQSCFTYLSYNRWYRFAADKLFVTSQGAFLRETRKTDRSDMVSILSEGQFLYVHHLDMYERIETKNAGEARWLTYEIEHFYRSHPPMLQTSDTDGHQYVMDRLFSGKVPMFSVFCPACGERFHLNGECYEYARSEMTCRNCSHRFSVTTGLSEQNVSMATTPFVAKWTDKSRVVRKANRLEMRICMSRGSGLFGGIYAQTCAIILSLVVVFGFIVQPFIDVYRSGLLIMNLQYASIDPALVALQPFWSIPVGIVLLLMLGAFSRSSWRETFLRWKLVVTPEGLKYSFGIFRTRVRTLPLTADLCFCPRNDKRKENDVDPSNPALLQDHAVTICTGNDYFGELPCADADEVRRLCALLTEFVALTLPRPAVNAKVDDI